MGEEIRSIDRNLDKVLNTLMTRLEGLEAAILAAREGSSEPKPPPKKVTCTVAASRALSMYVSLVICLSVKPRATCPACFCAPSGFCVGHHTSMRPFWWPPLRRRKIG